MGLFNTLDTSYSGLNTSQLQTATVGQNIANANTEGYTRQRVVTQAKEPLHSIPGDLGRGVKFVSVTRIHNEFVFGRLKNSSSNLEYSKFSKQTLEEVAQSFPDTDGVGLQNDIKNYFDSWNSLASSPMSSAAKTALAQSTITLSENMQDTRSRVRKTQDALNDQLKISVDEVNNIGKKIAELNAKIGNIESVKYNNANDLRDQRDKLELSLARLVNISVFKGDMKSDMSIDRNLTDSGREYYLNIAGESFVDGASFHPLVTDNKGNESKYYSVYHESQDGSRVDMSDRIQGGKIGSILDLRGREIDPKTSYPSDGKLQGYIDSLDTFAKGIIEKTNSVYASSATDSMISPKLDISNGMVLLNNKDYNFKEGAFDIVMYDNNGNEVGRKSINIDSSTTLNDGTTNSIISKINLSSDDNADNNSTNDIDDYFTASYNGNILSIKPNSNNPGYKIAIEDNGTNFAGVTQINSFLNGDSAKNIALRNEFKSDPVLINAYKAPVDGDNEVANDMLQIQYEQIAFKEKNGFIINDTPDGFYRNLTSQIAVDAEKSANDVDTTTAVFNAVNSEQQSISGVNIDEELTNLLKYQTAYSANAKVISSIDKMLDTLLTIKQ